MKAMGDFVGEMGKRERALETHPTERPCEETSIDGH